MITPRDPVYYDISSFNHGVIRPSHIVLFGLPNEVMSSISKTRHLIHVTLYLAPMNVPFALKAYRALCGEAWEEPQWDFCQIVQNMDEPGIIRLQEACGASRK
jgi:hypothetical protein